MSHQLKDKDLDWDSDPDTQAPVSEDKPSEPVHVETEQVLNQLGMDCFGFSGSLFRVDLVDFLLFIRSILCYFFVLLMCTFENIFSCRAKLAEKCPKMKLNDFIRKYVLDSKV